MAKQAGYKIIGTIGGISFYTMEGMWLARRKSCLDGERFRNDPAFERSRKAGQKFGAAIRKATALYRSLPPEERRIEKFKEIRKACLKELKQTSAH